MNSAISRDKNLFNKPWNLLVNWINSATKTEVTQTYYDNLPFTVSGMPVMENLRNRVAATTFEPTYDGINSTYESAKHYSYDIHGNVKLLVNELQMGTFAAIA